MADLTFLHGGNIYGVKKKAGEEIIDFSANINPLGLPYQIKKAIYKNFGRILHYPDPEAKGITRKIAQYWKIKEENVLVGSGSVEFIYLISSVFKPKTTLIPVPTFSEYERAIRTVKSRIKFLSLREKEAFKLSLSDIGSSDMLFLCNPNNPTGNLLLKDYKEAERIPAKLLVVDEAFMDFLPNQKDYTLIYRALKNKKIVVLRTLTKFFALPGLRVGYVIAHREIISRLRQYQLPWSTNSLAQMAGEMILDDKGYIKKTHRLVEKERRFLFQQLNEIKGLKCYPTMTNFFLLKIERPDINSKYLQELLIKRGILIRDCSNFRNLNNKFIRVAIRGRRENLKLVKELSSILLETEKKK